MVGVMLLAFAVVALRFLPRRWPVVTLQSGRTITHVRTEIRTMPGEPPLLLTRYETRTPLTQRDVLKTEMLELWPDAKRRLESAGYVNAGFWAEAPPTGLCWRYTGLCTYERFGFLVQKRADGTWHLSNDEEALP